MNWWKGLKVRVRLKESLKDKNTFKVGGPARFFSQPGNIEELRLLVGVARRNKIPIFVLGAGSNILINDRGINGLVIKLDSPYFKRISLSRERLEAGAGLLLNQLIHAAAKSGLSGLEFLAGIPGTVGGALAMNAGAWNRSIADSLEKVNVMDYNGKLKTLFKKDVRFGYRRSSLGKYIILSTGLKLGKRNKRKIKSKIREFLRQRQKTQDCSFPSAGCVFKNPLKESAGRLIDLCGLKGEKIGGAVISQKHANFILNKGNAKTGDILSLMRLVKKQVKKKFNIILQPEIKIWD